MRVDCSVTSIPSFRIDVSLSSKSIQFSVKTTRMEPDDKIELREVLRLLHLSLDQHLGSRKVLKVFIIYNNIDGISWTLQVVSSNFDSFKNGKQFLAICIVIQFCHSKNVRVKSNQINFIFFINNGKNCSGSIVQSISFHDELSIENPISENRCYDLEPKGLSNKTTLVLSNTRELDRVPSSE